MKKSFLQFLFIIWTIFPVISYAQSDGLPRGAYDLPYTRYESENATRNASAQLRSSPEYRMNEIASEASDQKYVALTNGGSVTWTMNNSGAGFNMRFTLPDAGSTGQSGSLDLYVNNAFVKTINLTSYWAYQYFNMYEHDPRNIGPATFTFMRFDEVHFRLANKLNNGDVVRIQNTSSLEIGVDFIEIEEVPAALGKPTGYISVVDKGAIPNDGIDDQAAFNAAITEADAANTGIYIPEGQFTLANCWRVSASNIGIKGAGMWYTNVHYSTNAYFSGGLMSSSTNLDISDIYFSTNNNIRWENGVYRVYKGLMGSYGLNSKLQRLWIEHFECGMWIGDYDNNPLQHTSGLLISHCRIRNNYADGINLCQGTNNSIIEFCSVRNEGDDGLASWSAKDMGNTVECTNIEIRNNTIENNWRAGSIGIFGGSNHKIHHNYIKDGVAGSGIRFTTEFPGYHFENNTNMQIYENTMISCGTSTDLVNQEKGAIELYDAQGPIQNMFFTNNTIINAQRHGIILGAGTINNIRFDNQIIDGTGLDPETKSAFAAPSGGYAIFCFSSSGTTTFNNLVTSRLEEPALYYKGQQGYNLIINSAPPVSPTSVAITPTTAVSVQQGSTTQLTATVSPSNATNKNVTWSSSNNGIATVNAAGLVTGVAPGTVTITVTTVDAGKTATKSVTVTAGAPAVSSASTATGTVNTVFNYSITASNNPTSYGATGLPAGLTVNTSSGLISGTPTASGSFNATVSATNAAGTGSKTVTFTINPAPTAPVISSSGTATGTQNAAFNYAITASQNPTSYGATGLPAGLSINTSTGVISGTPTTTGTTNVTVTATNSIGTGSKVVAIIINAAPPCTGPLINFTASAPVIDQNIDAVWSNASAGSITHATIGSTPADFAGSQWRALYDNTNLYVLVEVKDSNRFNDSGGSWWDDDVVEIFIDGNNNKGTSYDGQNDFQYGFRYNDATLKVGGNSVTRTSGVVFSQHNVTNGYNIEVTIPWTTIGVTPSSGNKIGFDISIDDDDNAGTRDSQMAAFASTSDAWANPSVFGSVTLCSGSVVQAPVVNNTSLPGGAVGSAYNASISASNSPTSYGATGLPSGLTVNTSTGVISGTPTASGTFTVTLSATNSGGTGTKQLSLVINPATPSAPVVSNTSLPNGTVGSAYSTTISASNSPTSYGATGLPAGLNVNTSSGVISGTPTASGTFTVTLSATNGGGTGTKQLSLVINPSTPAAPVVNNTSLPNGTVGSAYNTTINASNSPTSFGATGLPAGLSVNTSTGVISGTPTASGTFTVTLSAANTGGTGTKQLSLVVNAASGPPVINNTSLASANVGSAYNVSISATNTPTSYNATGLPSGLSVNTSSGAISGTPTESGSFSVVLSATNASGTGSKTLTLTVAEPANVISGYRAPGSITVNGSLSESGWNLVKTVTKNTVGTGNNTVKFAVMWDNTNLYVGVRVVDANLFSDSPDSWEDDAVEVYIDANNNKLGNYDGRDNQIIKNYNKSTVFTKLSIAGLQHAWASVSGGYSVEIAIPWTELGFPSTPAAGAQLGLDVAYDDDDNGGSRDAQAVWNGTVNNYQNTSAFGTLVLSNAARTGTSRISQEVSEEDIHVEYWPNMVVNELNIVSDGTFERVEVVDLVGRQVMSEPIFGRKEVQLDMHELTGGLHIVRMTAVNKQYVFRIIKK